MNFGMRWNEMWSLYFFFFKKNRCIPSLFLWGISLQWCGNCRGSWNQVDDATHCFVQCLYTHHIHDMCTYINIHLIRVSIHIYLQLKWCVEKNIVVYMYMNCWIEVKTGHQVISNSALVPTALDNPVRKYQGVNGVLPSIAAIVKHTYCDRGSPSYVPLPSRHTYTSSQLTPPFFLFLPSSLSLSINLQRPSPITFLQSGNFFY